MSFPVGLVMVLATVWIAHMGRSYPRQGFAWRVCRSSAARWGLFVSAIFCLAYSAGMALSDLCAYGSVSFWLGMNLVFSSLFWVIPTSVLLSSVSVAIAGRGKPARDSSVGRPGAAKGIVAVCALLLAVGLYASLYEPNAVSLTRVTVASRKLPAGSDLRLVQLSDLHIARLGLRERRTLGLVLSERPDVIFLTGDYLDNPKARPKVKEFLSRLHAPFGIFAVAGADDRNSELSNIFEGTSIKILQNETARVEVRKTALTVAGLKPDAPDLRRVFAQVQPDLFTILLSHSPRIFESRPPADLLLAGQSHGGQIAVPALRGMIISYLRGNPRYDEGLFRKGQLAMYVNPGLGMENGDAPRIRCLVPPEVTLITVVGTGPRPEVQPNPAPPPSPEAAPQTPPQAEPPAAPEQPNPTSG